MSNLIVNILENFLGDHKKHNESKCQVSFDCPACASDKMLDNGDGKGKLEVNYKKGVFKCWVCSYKNNMHGPIEKLINTYGTKTNLRDYKLLKVDNDYYKENSFLEDKVLINVELPKEFISLTNCSKFSPKSYYALNYLNKRGIGEDIIKEFNIGYAHEGLYKNRIIIPSYDINGNINFFVSRSFDKYTKPKYLNPEAEKELIIFNEHKVNWDATIYLVEGPFDHIVTPNSIVLLGKVLSPLIKSLLFEKAKADVIIVLDDDAYEDAINIYKELNFDSLYGRIKICKPPYGYDSSLIYEKLGKKGIYKFLKNAKRLSEDELY